MLVIKKYIIEKKEYKLLRFIIRIYRTTFQKSMWIVKLSALFCF